MNEVSLVSVVPLFAAQAQQNPGHLAVHSATKSLSYAALEKNSSHLARRIFCQTQAADASQSTPVAILMAHSANLLVAILAVLKSGRPYTALDPRFPPAQLLQQLRHCGPAILLADAVHQYLAQQLCEETGTPLMLHSEEFSDENQTQLPEISPPISPKNSAAIFYTSGSTGAPKGVLQNHACIANTARNYIEAMAISPQDKVLWITSAAVGASSSVLFGALCAGATLCAFDLKAQNLSALLRTIKTERITVLHCVPSLFRSLLEGLKDDALSSLRIIKLGGEAVTRGDFNIFKNAVDSGILMSDCRLLNGLGITEAGGNVCFYEASEDAFAGHTIPVGFAARGYELSLLRDESTLHEDGGELIITGDFLADGYWNQPKETAKVFSDLPDGKRSYRSGDRVRFLQGGALEYLGRKDHQVKIRGQRVDLSAVETALQAVPSVRGAAVIFLESDDGKSNPQLIGCHATGEQENINSDILRRALSTSLPEFMIPTKFVRIENWPLLPTGKIDRKALLKEIQNSANTENSLRCKALPEMQANNSTADDSLEAQMQLIWQQALKLQNVQPDDDFFALGGHSLAAAEISSALYNRFSLDIPLTALAQFPTIRKLLQAFREGHAIGATRLLKLQPHGNCAPLFCIPGAGSDAFSLLELSTHLDADQPFFALQPPGLDGASAFPETIEGFADYYLEAIEGAMPRGPYFLAGSSMGGVIMFEVARQLQARGEEIALLMLIDAKAAGYPNPRRYLGVKTPLASLWEMLPLQDKNSFSPRNIRRGWREQRFNKFAWREIQSGLPRPHERRFLHLRLANFDAKERYQPEALAGDLHLFTAEIQPSSRVFQPDENLGWAKYVDGKITRRVVPGRHGDYLREPNARVLAQYFNEALREAQAQQAPKQQAEYSRSA